MAVKEISVIGRNTQGVRIMSMDEADTLAAVVRVAKEEGEVAEATEGNAPPPADSPADPPVTGET